MVSAIRHMHEHDVLHRDLKTANIFLTKDGIIKIGDFGISKMLTTRGGGAHTVLVMFKIVIIKVLNRMYIICFSREHLTILVRKCAREKFMMKSLTFGK